MIKLTSMSQKNKSQFITLQEMSRNARWKKDKNILLTLVSHTSDAAEREFLQLLS